MFNGIIFNRGIVQSIKKTKSSSLVEIKSNLKISKKDIGCSISCNGVCLTLIAVKNKSLFFYLSLETLKRSNFKYLVKYISNRCFAICTCYCDYIFRF